MQSKAAVLQHREYTHILLVPTKRVDGFFGEMLGLRVHGETSGHTGDLETPEGISTCAGQTTETAGAAIVDRGAKAGATKSELNGPKRESTNYYNAVDAKTATGDDDSSETSNDNGAVAGVNARTRKRRYQMMVWGSRRRNLTNRDNMTINDGRHNIEQDHHLHQHEEYFTIHGDAVIPCAPQLALELIEGFDTSF